MGLAMGMSNTGEGGSMTGGTDGGVDEGEAVDAGRAKVGTQRVASKAVGWKNEIEQVHGIW